MNDTLLGFYLWHSTGVWEIYEDALITAIVVVV